MTFKKVNPTAQDVKDLWTFMQGHYKTRIIEKSSAVEMKAIAKLLALMKIMDTKTFLERCTTTLGNGIYIPHPIGTEAPGWSLWGQIEICVHEHIHVEQDRNAGGLKYEWNYITSSAARTMYEVVAFRSGMEVSWKYRRVIPSPFAIADLLKMYACNADDIRVAGKALATSVPSIKAGGLSNEVTRTACAWLDTRFAA